MFRVYGKTITAVALAVFMALQAALPDHLVNNTEWVQILTAAFTALSVFLVPVVPQYPWVKSAIGVALSVLSVLLTLVVDGWQFTDWMPLLIALATAVGVTFSPAVSDTRPPTPAQP